MPTRSGLSPLSPLHPVRVFGLVLGLVFFVEGSIMLLLPRLSQHLQIELKDSFLDAGLLTVLIAPAVWLLAILPLRRLFEERGNLLTRQFHAQEEERTRIARDLHDGVGQQLTAMLVSIRTIDSELSLEDARRRGAHLRELTIAAHEEIRRIARGLHPAVLAELGLRAAIEHLCDEFRRTHDLQVTCVADKVRDRYSPELEISVYRIVQEALSNVARHAQARGVTVRLDASSDELICVIADDGVGIAPQARPTAGGHLGLCGMRERVALLNGAYELTSAPGEGTTIRVSLPVNR